jgi:AraC-like DNA-binding protein
LIGFETLDYGLSLSAGSFYLYITILALLTLNASLLFFPNILYGLPQFDYVISQIAKQRLDVDPVEDAAKKQSKAFEISNEKLDLLKFKVDKYCQDKPFLLPDFNLTMMSADTDIPVHHLSYFFNEYLKVNFNTWKNDHKIDYIIELIQGGSNEMLTLDALAKQAGFGSRTTFFNAFKQKMGVTPSEYLSNME